MGTVSFVSVAQLLNSETSLKSVSRAACKVSGLGQPRSTDSSGEELFVVVQAAVSIASDSFSFGAVVSLTLR